MTFRDHIVAFRQEASIAELAIGARRVAGINDLNSFDIIEYILRLTKVVIPIKGHLKVKFYDACLAEDPAFVTYNPLTLHVDTEVWDLARMGDPWARWVLAHELGHIFLHDHHAKRFSDDPKLQIPYAMREQSAEWQADVFASNFLLPRHILEAHMLPGNIIANLCAVPSKIVEERMKFSASFMKKQTGDYCPECGNFDLSWDGFNEICQTCGWSASS